MVEFGGWMMPIQYSSVLKEHSAVRNSAGLFDVSHMGEIKISGPGAFDFTNRIITNDVSELQTGGALYSVMCRKNGGVVDDLLVYRMDKEKFLLVLNAANREKGYNWISSNVPEKGVELNDVSDDFALLAIQGPKAVGIFEKVAKIPENLPYYAFYETTFEGIEIIVSRTGYTGEDGLEIFLPSDKAVNLWDALMDAGKDEGLLPAGLAARDLLRIESGYSLYGHELDEEIDPITAGLSWAVKMNASDFIGRPALAALKPAKKRIGIVMEGRSIPRCGYPVIANGERIGEVTSGTFSPVLQKPIGIGYIAMNRNSGREKFKVGDKISVEIRGKKVAAVISRMPFIKLGTVKKHLGAVKKH
ncbi:MAG: aminomethyltransferase [bacterium]|nr:MAG: aminomethyltransferase [bacterium]